MNNEINCPVCYDENIQNYIIIECKHSICLKCYSKIYSINKKFDCPTCRKNIINPIHDIVLIKPIDYKITHDYEDDIKVKINTNHIKYSTINLYFYVSMKYKDFFMSNNRRTEMIFKRIVEEVNIYVKKIIENWNYYVGNVNGLNDSDDEDNDNITIIFDEKQKSTSGELFIYRKNENYNNFTVIVY